MTRFPEMSPQWPRTRPCKIAFVAEAPADEEVLKGQPLVGPTGRLFDHLLRMAGIDRGECLVTNTIAVQAGPDNDVENFMVNRKARDIAAMEGYDLPAFRKGAFLDPKLVWHLDRLRDEIAACKPNIVVALGGLALWAFTGWSNIMARRGAVCEASMTVPGVKVIPTSHPALLFKKYKLLPAIVRDLIKAKRECEYPEIRYTKREVFVAESPAEIEAWAEENLVPAEWISIDIETIPKFRQITSIAFAPDRYRSLVVPFVDQRKVDRCYWPSAEAECAAWKAVKRVCELPNPKLGQNFDYDFRWLYDRGIGVRNAVQDTRLMHHALFPELPKDLQFLGAMYANEAAWKQYSSAKFEKREG